MGKKNYARKYAKDLNIWTRLYQYYAVFLFHLIFGIFYRIKYEGRNNIPKDRNVIIAANHISYFDPLLVTAASGIRVAYMAKKELFENKWLGKNIDRLGAFAVNREKVEVSTIKSALDVFKAKWSLGIFPQGGIRRNKAIEHVNKGFIAFAKMSKVDIIPMGITGCEEYNWMPLRGKIEVKIGRAISYELSEEEIIKEWSKQICELTGYENRIKIEEFK